MRTYLFKISLLNLLFSLVHTCVYGQQVVIKGRVTSISGEPVAAATIQLPALKLLSKSDSIGRYIFTNVPVGKWQIEAKHLAHQPEAGDITVATDTLEYDFKLPPRHEHSLGEVVISGTLKEVSKLDSPVPVEVYTSKFFKANPTPSLFDALQNINGVRPQLNCNICNTGDIHINGLEGPYTMILIDGMPIVSGLSTVYGLSGIPQSLIDRIEIVKGPASTLYGSEAVGGLINIITKSPDKVPLLSLESMGTSWREANVDISAKAAISSKVESLLGLSYFNYQDPADHNHDNFTDVTLQHRISVFNKWNMKRKDNRQFSLAGRYVYEDRWGGEMNWNKQFRGGDEVYGESIYTRRWELFGNYQLPTKEHILFQFSSNGHHQNSVYGNIPYLADQFIGFGQLTWFKNVGKHDLVTGLTYRYTYYDDNTPATAHATDLMRNQPSRTQLPGLFVQDEWTFNKNHKVLLGLRYDYNSIHGSILAPRINYKWTSTDENNVLRVSIGNGYRVANVFTEDHAALTGSREVIFANHLRPETSWNGNLNFVKKLMLGDTHLGLDATAFYTRFNNKIIADYDTHPNQIIYDNLNGHAVSKGLSLNVDLVFATGLKMLMGVTAMDVYSRRDGEKITQLFTEKFTGVWNIGYTINKLGLSIDYTGNVYGPMRLPLLSATDPRSDTSPWWSIQNIQLTQKIGKQVEVFAGVKNLLNWTPNKGTAFLIARANDPFDKRVQFDGAGQALVTADNPYGLTFDPSYVYGPNQGARGFLGFRYHLFKSAPGGS